MKKSLYIVLALVAFGCGGTSDLQESNPFLEGWEPEGKEDTGYVNLRYSETEVTLEGDIQASGYRFFRAPAEQTQFAVTYMKQLRGLYIEILLDEMNRPERTEWLVDGQWIGYQQAQRLDQTKLTHYRIQNVNAVIKTSSNVRVGEVLKAKVPLRPLTFMADAGDKCANPDNHISLDQSVYWYLYNPGRSGCPQELLTELSITVEEIFPANVESYPEYDKLWEDKKLTVAVFWAKLDDGDVKDDYNWGNFNQLVTWLKQANFVEQEGQALGKRLVKTVGELTEIVDVYGPDVFHSVADYSRLGNWQKAVSEHEVVMYNGHSVLGTGMAFKEITYPEHYQIFQVGSCLSYEYYVDPVLDGKGSWDKVDVLANLEPTYYSENLPLTSTVLAKLFWGFENGGRASWQDIMEAVSKKLGHARFGVSGARTNCFTPSGNRCQGGPTGQEKSFYAEPALAIPDNDKNGASNVIEISEDLDITALKVELDIAHSWVGDLKVTLSHDGVSRVLWNREGGSQKDIRQVFSVSDFVGKSARGTWTLQVVDSASRDTGTLNRWGLVVTTSGGQTPIEPRRYQNSQGLDIPDGDPNGVASIIEVPDSFQIASLRVELDISHSYIGDLQIELSHNGTPYALWNHVGGSADDIRQSFEVSVFNGQQASGVWTLKLSDDAEIDTGRLNSWTLVITPAP